MPKSFSAAFTSIFFPSNGFVQVDWVVSVLGIYIVFAVRLRPWKDDSNNWLDATVSLLLIIMQVGGLMFAKLTVIQLGQDSGAVDVFVSLVT